MFDVSLELPEGCPPVQPNEKGVGIPCTMGGGQCTAAGVPAGLRCTCDPYFGIQLYGVPCVCTNIKVQPQPGSRQHPERVHPARSSPTICGTEA